MKTSTKVISGIILFLVIAFAIFFYIRFYFVFSLTKVMFSRLMKAS